MGGVGYWWWGGGDLRLVTAVAHSLVLPWGSTECERLFVRVGVAAYHLPGVVCTGRGGGARSDAPSTLSLTPLSADPLPRHTGGSGWSCGGVGRARPCRRVRSSGARLRAGGRCRAQTPSIRPPCADVRSAGRGGGRAGGWACVSHCAAPPRAAGRPLSADPLPRHTGGSGWSCSGVGRARPFRRVRSSGARLRAGGRFRAQTPAGRPPCADVRSAGRGGGRAGG
jgi:hypothetical protein